MYMYDTVQKLHTYKIKKFLNKSFIGYIFFNKQSVYQWAQTVHYGLPICFFIHTKQNLYRNILKSGDKTVAPKFGEHVNGIYE